MQPILSDEERRMIRAYREFRVRDKRGVFHWHGYPGVDPLPTDKYAPDWRTNDEMRAGVPHHVEAQ